MSSPHGTHSRYVNGPCRCPACTAANNAYCAQRKKQRRAYVEANGLPATVQHGLSAYHNWGCRCEECRAAWSKYLRARS
jgi:hypothetical protein